MAFFPYIAATNDFNPLLRALDEAFDTKQTTCKNRASKLSPTRSFSPRFDVREVNDSYHLDGELPGIKQDDIEIEFSDDYTLVIKGHSKREYTTNTEKAAENDVADETASNKSSHQPTVEDEEGGIIVSTPTSETSTPENKEVGPKITNNNSGPKYWVSERAVGTFHRAFTFPVRVNQEEVRASLKDGILSIVVPKAAPPTTKRIRIE